jgi:predicted enzyme related to lactoylglutathione lyase
MPNPVVHFEIPADNEARAIKFYRDTFGWEINEFKMPDGSSYWLVGTSELDENMRHLHAGAINGGLMKRSGQEHAFVNYIDVPSIEDACRAVEANGGNVLMPRQEIAPGMGWIALFKDTEGNMAGLYQKTSN